MGQNLGPGLRTHLFKALAPFARHDSRTGPRHPSYPARICIFSPCFSQISLLGFYALSACPLRGPQPLRLAWSCSRSGLCF